MIPVAGLFTGRQASCKTVRVYLVRAILVDQYTVIGTKHDLTLHPAYGISGPRRENFVEQAVVYSTLPQEYSTLTFRGEVVAGGGGVEERSEVMYCIGGDMYI